MIVLGSQYWGQKRVGEVRRLSSIGLRAGLLIALLLVTFVPGIVTWLPNLLIH